MTKNHTMLASSTRGLLPWLAGLIPGGPGFAPRNRALVTRASQNARNPYSLSRE